MGNWLLVSDDILVEECFRNKLKILLSKNFPRFLVTANKITVVLDRCCNVPCKMLQYGKKRNMPGHRSSRPEVFCRKGVLKNFAKFT